MWPRTFAVYPSPFLSLYIFQGLLQNVYLVFENSVEDLLSKKGCQQSQGGRRVSCVWYPMSHLGGTPPSVCGEGPVGHK